MIAIEIISVLVRIIAINKEVRPVGSAENK